MRSIESSWQPTIAPGNLSVEELQKLGPAPAQQILDYLESQLKDLIKTRHPQRDLPAEELSALVRNYTSQRQDDLSRWVYFPWKTQWVRLLNPEDFIFLRTNRNTHKISSREQALLAEKRIGIVGLSVGSVVAMAMGLERSFGELRLTDFDTLDLSNLNRIPFGVGDLGVPKVVLAARTLYQLDPYLNIKIFESGLTQENVEEFFLGGGPLDLVVDECDSIDVKIRIRFQAQKMRIPVLMDTSDRGLLDIERFDLEPDRPPFHGRLGNPDPQNFASLTTEQKIPLVLQISGIETASAKAKASLIEIGQSIKTWPQLGADIFCGGGAVAETSRRILLGDDIPSGRHHFDLDLFIAAKPKLHNSSAFLPPSLEESKRQLFQDQRLAAQKSLTLEHPQGVKLPQSDLRDIIYKGTLAPSGGNNQPWILIPQQSSIFLWKRSFPEGILSPRGHASLLGLGACLENIRLASSVLGWRTLFVPADSLEMTPELQYLGRIDFLSALHDTTPEDRRLAEAIEKRATDRRHPHTKKNLDAAVINAVRGHIPSGYSLQFVQSGESMENLARWLGEFDRIRLMGEISHRELMEELRFTPEEAEAHRDGLDLRSFELSTLDRTGVELCRSWPVVESLKKWGLGQGLTKLASRPVEASSAIGLLTMSSPNQSRHWLEAGRVLEKVWLEFTQAGWSLQPMTASIFLMNRVEYGNADGLDDWQIDNIKKVGANLYQAFPGVEAETRLFLFRLSPSESGPIRSLRYLLPKE